MATGTPVSVLTDAQLKAEMARCEYCEDKPCREACPAHCSPADFIRAAMIGERSDFRRAAGIILGSNPLGGVCGAVCPDRHCVAACSRKGFDRPIDIPAVQAAIVQRAKDLSALPAFGRVRAGARRVAVVGAGPAGLGAAAVLARDGVKVDVYDARTRAGGMCLDIPDDRLDQRILATDIEWLLALGPVQLKTGRRVRDPAALKARGYDAVLVATGLDAPLQLGIPGEKAAIDWRTWLESEAPPDVAGKRVAVIGGGAVAVDCAEVAVHRRAASVELFALESFAEMPLTEKERHSLADAGVQVTGRTRVTRIVRAAGRVAGLKTVRVDLPAGLRFHPRNVVEVPGTAQARPDVEVVIVAIGARGAQTDAGQAGVVFVGDVGNGPTTVVEAVAAGKNAAAALLRGFAGEAPVQVARDTKSRVGLKGREVLPVALDCDFFGTPIRSPFLLSAAPPTDGYDQMRKAYEAGWAGGVMKTAFDNVPIHIPSRYMFAFSPTTYANCDNVSGHPLDRVCREIERLRREFPDRLTLGSSGGPVTGDDESDARGWQSNTRKLEAAGACGIEYSLSCPQGGDGTKGDIVSQDAELTARIVGWVLEAGDPSVPKLFKLTGAVTSIYPVLAAIREVFARHPKARAGVTLANTFPTLAFRTGAKTSWDEGVVVGMSGEAVAPISNLTLANAARHGLVVSGNGGPMDHKAAAHFLALGARTVQFCTIVMKHGYGIVDDLHSGLSHLMAERGIRSVGRLIGCALPQPITGFMDLSPVKMISAVRAEMCRHCGNCTRCPYLAITPDAAKVPVTDPARCIGCSICAQKCFAGALYMRDRTPAEAGALRED